MGLQEVAAIHGSVLLGDHEIAMSLGFAFFVSDIPDKGQHLNLLANFHYEPRTDALEPNLNGFHPAGQTKFLGFKEGKLIFEGGQEEMEASKDPYVSKFVKHNG